MQLVADQKEFAEIKDTKICRISTIPFSFVAQTRGLLNYLRAIGMNVTCVSSAGSELAEIEWGNGLEHVVIDIPRSLEPFKDIHAFARLFLFFRKQQYAIVHSTTPKAGLLTALAAFIARVPIRLHTFTGQPWVTLKGPMRWFARFSDRVIGFLNTMCYADSMSQRQFLIVEGIIPVSKIKVIGTGSLAGVDLRRFDPGRWSASEKIQMRQELAISREAQVIIYVGRIAVSKGIAELLSAFQSLLSRGYNIDLLLVGPLDSDCGGSDSLKVDNFTAHPRIHFVGYTDCPEKYLAIADIFCLPSYREGFGTVIIEAAAMGLPAVGTDIYGLNDAIVHNQTGILVPPRDDQTLSQALQNMLDDPELLQKFGLAARKRCQQYFDAALMNRKIAEEYRGLLNNRSH